MHAHPNELHAGDTREHCGFPGGVLQQHTKREAGTQKVPCTGVQDRYLSCVDVTWREREMQLTHSFIFQPILLSTYHVPGPALCARILQAPQGPASSPSLLLPLSSSCC